MAGYNIQATVILLDPEKIGEGKLACLHDLAKGQPHHAQTGEMLLIRMGYPEVANIVGSHMDINLLGADFLSEKELVYLADYHAIA
jgi:hypothetical protein